VRVISNLPEISRALHDLGQVFNLRRPTGRGRLGDVLLTRVSEAIVYRSLTKQGDPEGRPWKRLSARYLRRKIAAGLSPLKNVATGEMMQVEEIRGRTIVASHGAQLTAGLDDAVADKVEWAEEGGKNRPPRKSMDLGKDGEAAVDEVFEGAILERLGSL
jgi:hypothetical protein